MTGFFLTKSECDIEGDESQCTFNPGDSEREMFLLISVVVVAISINAVLIVLTRTNIFGTKFYYKHSKPWAVGISGDALSG